MPSLSNATGQRESGATRCHAINVGLLRQRNAYEPISPFIGIGRTPNEDDVFDRLSNGEIRGTNSTPGLEP